jgi:hypothetical protein
MLSRRFLKAAVKTGSCFGLQSSQTSRFQDHHLKPPALLIGQMYLPDTPSKTVFEMILLIKVLMEFREQFPQHATSRRMNA